MLGLLQLSGKALPSWKYFLQHLPLCNKQFEFVIQGNPKIFVLFGLRAGLSKMFGFVETKWMIVSFWFDLFVIGRG